MGKCTSIPQPEREGWSPKGGGVITSVVLVNHNYYQTPL